MDLKIHSITVGKDNKIYVCLKPPTENGLEPLSQHVTICYTLQSLPKLMQMKHDEKIGFIPKEKVKANP